MMRLPCCKRVFENPMEERAPDKKFYCVECASPLDEVESGIGVDAASGRKKMDI